MNKFYVIDDEDNTLFQGKQADDAPQVFNSFDAAERRAMKAAASDPGGEYKIVRVEAIVACEIGKPKTRRIL